MKLGYHKGRDSYQIIIVEFYLDFAATSYFVTNKLCKVKAFGMISIREIQEIFNAYFYILQE